MNNLKREKKNILSRKYGQNMTISWGLYVTSTLFLFLSLLSLRNDCYKMQNTKVLITDLQKCDHQASYSAIC